MGGEFWMMEINWFGIGSRKKREMCKRDDFSLRPGLSFESSRVRFPSCMKTEASSSLISC